MTIDEQPQDETLTDYKLTILETFAQILLNQDKALLANLISKNTIIVPATSLQQIIKSITKAESVDILKSSMKMVKYVQISNRHLTKSSMI